MRTTATYALGAWDSKQCLVILIRGCATTRIIAESGFRVISMFRAPEVVPQWAQKNAMTHVVWQATGAVLLDSEQLTVMISGAVTPCHAVKHA